MKKLLGYIIMPLVWLESAGLCVFFSFLSDHHEFIDYFAATRRDVSEPLQSVIVWLRNGRLDELCPFIWALLALSILLRILRTLVQRPASLPYAAVITKGVAYICLAPMALVCIMNNRYIDIAVMIVMISYQLFAGLLAAIIDDAVMIVRTRKIRTNMTSKLERQR